MPRLTIAHRTCYTVFIAFKFGMPACTQLRRQVLSSTWPVCSVGQTSLPFFKFEVADLHPGSTALSYNACTQNMSGAYPSFQLYGCRPKVPAHRMCQNLIIVFTFIRKHPSEGKCQPLSTIMLISESHRRTRISF